MSARDSEQGGAAVSLGHVTVHLKAYINPADVTCKLTYRGSVVDVVYGPDGEVLEIKLPPGSDPDITS